MNYGSAVLIGDALGKILRRPIAPGLWMVAVAAVLVSGTALFLIPTAPGAMGVATESYLLAQLGLGPSEAAIARLGSQIWTWPGVDGVTFRFPGEDDPIAISERTLVVRLLSAEARATVESRLRALPEVEGVRYHEQPSARVRVPPASRVAALVALVGTLALALWLGHRSITRAVALWGKELALLRSCGVRPALMRAPLFTLGAVVGLGGGGLYIVVCWVLWKWGRSLPYLRDVVPSFPYVWPGLVIAGLAIGLGLGLGGALIATLAPPSRS
ncbi:MAG: hypothetical protein Kow0097_01960 [Candidatus Bipolaricaulota bacterium]|nr:hypothetical protein [Candidatus Bipolaricaulota bacterium]